MPECKYRLCENTFELRRRGKKKEYCCVKHRKAEGRLKYAEIGSMEDFKNRVSAKQKQAARERAILNCADYIGCLNIAYRADGDMDCHNCDKPTATDAWKLEPGVLINNDFYDFANHIA